LSDRPIESHYMTGEVPERLGELIAEAGGPGPPIWDSNPVDGITALGAVDVPRGEFWIRHRGIFLVKEIASAAHVYDKRLVDAESFTTWRRWIDGPLAHKEIADRALCEGLNSFSFHTFASSPPSPRWWTARPAMRGGSGSMRTSSCATTRPPSSCAVAI
jgi:hypothetical protein